MDLNSGQITIQCGKGGKPRYTFINITTLKAIRTHLRIRGDHNSPALFVSKTNERLTYDGLRQLLQRRSKKASLKKEPTLHDFRRQFAVSMLNNGVDIFSLQRLMGHSDISMLRRYLAQTQKILVLHTQNILLLKTIHGDLPNAYPKSPYQIDFRVSQRQ